MKCKVPSGTPVCQAPHNGYLCSRQEGHKGLHHAHGEECHKWKSKSSSSERTKTPQTKSDERMGKRQNSKTGLQGRPEVN